MDAKTNGTAVTAESLLLGRIEDELTQLSEQQHALARRVAVLRKARTMLHVGGSTFEVNAMLAEHARREAPRKNWSGPAGYDSDVQSLIDSSSWSLESSPVEHARNHVDRSEVRTLSGS